MSLQTLHDSRGPCTSPTHGPEPWRNYPPGLYSRWCEECMRWIRWRVPVGAPGFNNEKGDGDEV